MKKLKKGAVVKESITFHIEQDLLIKVLQKAKEKKSNISSLIRYFFLRIVQTDSLYDFSSSSKRQPGQSLDDYLKQIEKLEILKACSETETKHDASKVLGISYRSMRYRIDQYGIDF